MHDPCKTRCELQNRMATPNRGTVPVSYCLYAGLSQLSLPSVLTGAQWGNLPPLSPIKQRRENHDSAYYDNKQAHPAFPVLHSAGHPAPAGQQPPPKRSPPAAAPPPAPAHGPDLCLGLGKLRRAWSLWPCHPPVPGAARPGPPSRWGRGEPESGRAWGRELRRGRPGALRPCRGQAGAGGG